MRQQFKLTKKPIKTLSLPGCTSGAAGLSTTFVWIGVSLLSAGCGSDSKSSDQAPTSTPSAASEAPVAVTRGGGELSDYLAPVPVDPANPDVTDAEREANEGKRGGRLRIRTSSQYSTFNGILVQAAPDAEVVNHLSDSLVEFDTATLEHYPDMAWRWDSADLVKTKSGEVRQGRIVEETADSIVFVPDAWRIHIAPVDVAERSESGLTLTAQRGSESFSGSVEEKRFVLVVDQGFAPEAKRETIAKSDLDSYEESFGTRTESFPYAKGECAWRFHLRDGITWHDGEPFSAEDIVFSLDTIFNTNVDAQRIRVTYDVLESYGASDDGLLFEARTKRPYYQTLQYLGFSIGNRALLPKHIFNPTQYGGDEKAFAEAFNKHPFNLNPVYTGPYRLKDHQNDRLTLERNPTYWKNQLPEGTVAKWKSGMPYQDEVQWILYKDSAGALRDLQNGKLDVWNQAEPVVWNQSESQTKSFTDAIVRMENLSFAYTYIGWNLRKPMFQDPELRRALSLLIPRQEIADNVHMGAAIPISGPFYINGPLHNPEIKPDPYDPTQAKRLLTRGGWLDRDGDGILEKELNGVMTPLKFTYSIHNAMDYHQKIADIVKERLEQVGASVTIQKYEWTLFADIARDGNFDAIRYAWGQELDSDPYPLWHSSQIENKGDNFIAYRNDRVDEICEQYRRELDPMKRWKMGRELHQIVKEENAQCFMFAFKNFAFIHRNLRGVRFYPTSYPHNYGEWYWKN